MRITDLSTLDYRAAWAQQEAVHAGVLAGGEEQVLIVQHPPTITFGRRAADSASHLVASAELLSEMHVDVVESDRGGDITFHGPGQIVAYPIVRLADRRLSVGGYVKTLEHAVIATLADFGIAARLEAGAIGVWCDTPAGLAKICALGVRIKRGVTLHGVALNVRTDLAYFNLIVPCGLTGRPVTSMEHVLGDACPPTATIAMTLARRIVEALGG